MIFTYTDERGGNEVVTPLCYAPSKEWLRKHVRKEIAEKVVEVKNEDV